MRNKVHGTILVVLGPVVLLLALLDGVKGHVGHAVFLGAVGVILLAGGDRILRRAGG
ncbi:MAG: hypothetical protein ACREH9_07250 [Pseudomonadota bacterium]